MVFPLRVECLIRLLACRVPSVGREQKFCCLRVSKPQLVGWNYRCLLQDILRVGLDRVDAAKRGVREMRAVRAVSAKNDEYEAIENNESDVHFRSLP